MEITQQCVHIDEVIVILFGEPVDVISLACFVIEAKDAYAIRNKREPVFVTMGASASGLGTRQMTNSANNTSAMATRRFKSNSASMM